MRSLVLIVLFLAAAAIAALPGQAAGEGSGDEELMTATATPAAAMTSPPGSKALPPRLDDRTRDLLVMAALVCILLASLLLNSGALRRRPTGRTPGRRRAIEPEEG